MRVWSGKAPARCLSAGSVLLDKGRLDAWWNFSGAARVSPAVCPPVPTDATGTVSVFSPERQPGDRPPDQHPPDLRRALEDGEDPAGRDSSAVQRPADSRDISTDSARPVRDECRLRVGPRPVSVVVRTHVEKAANRTIPLFPRQYPSMARPVSD
jgi:hypothetical protein